jgi:hypothetical protein
MNNMLIVPGTNIVIDGDDPTKVFLAMHVEEIDPVTGVGTRRTFLEPIEIRTDEESIRNFHKNPKGCGYGIHAKIGPVKSDR